MLASPLPSIAQGGLTIDASDAGVVLDGSRLSGGSSGLSIASDGNTVKGLHILRFPYAGIRIDGGASNNLITDIGGTAALGNEHGVSIVGGAQHNRIG